MLPDKAVSDESLRAAQHFHAVADPNAVFLVATPPYASTDHDGGGYCAYHGYQDAIAYINLPFVVVSGTDCGANSVNAQDGGPRRSVHRAGHEYLEAITDRATAGLASSRLARSGLRGERRQVLWVRVGPGKLTDITLATGTFAVQGTWSNQALHGAGACATGGNP